MAKTLWVKATTDDRQVIVSEYDESHPTPNHEIFIAGYPNVVTDTGDLVVGNVPIEVGDTALIRQRMAEGALIETSQPSEPRRPGEPDRHGRERSGAEEEERRAEEEQRRRNAAPEAPEVKKR